MNLYTANSHSQNKEDLTQLLQNLVSVVLSGLMFQYSYYTLTGQDIWWLYDMFMGLIIFTMFRFWNYNLGRDVNFYLLVVCFAGRVLLGYQPPWIFSNG